MKSLLLAAVIASSALASASSESSVDSTFNDLSNGAKSFNELILKQAVPVESDKVGVQASGLVQTWLLRSQNLLSDDLDCSIPDDSSVGINLLFCSNTGTTIAPSSENRECVVSGDDITVNFYSYSTTSDCSGTPTLYKTFPLLGAAVPNSCYNYGTVTCSSKVEPWQSEAGMMRQYFADATCANSVNAVSHYAVLRDGCWATNIDSSVHASSAYADCEPASGVTLDLYTSTNCAGRSVKTQAKTFESCYLHGSGDDLIDDGYKEVYGSCCTYDDSTCRVLGAPPSDDDDKGCFSAESQVALEGGATKAMSDVQVGDRVLVATAAGELEFSEVVFVPHAANSVKKTFVDIETESGRQLKVTNNHLVSAGPCGAEKSLVRAEDIVIGACVQAASGSALLEDRVASVTASVGSGVYTAVAMDSNGQLVVDGIVASSFGVNHQFTNMFYSVHRVFYGLFGAIFAGDETVKANTLIGEVVASAYNN